MKEIMLDDLVCALSPDEVNDRAQQLSSTIKQADEIEAEKKTSAKHYKDQLDALGGQIRKLSFVIRERAESRPVVCGVMYHSPSSGTKRIVRSDTGEIVRDEAMTHFEMQNNLFEDQHPATDERSVEEIAADVVALGAEQQVLTVLAAAKGARGKRKKGEGEYTPEPGQA